MGGGGGGGGGSLTSRNRRLTVQTAETIDIAAPQSIRPFYEGGHAATHAYGVASDTARSYSQGGVVSSMHTSS